MTNLEWIRTLSEEEFADWLYDEWLHHLQYRWSSSRGGLIIWLKDRKTENSSEKPNNYCDDCLYNDTCDSKEFFYACTSKATRIAKGEQTQLTAKCLNCNNSKACKENHWEGCIYEPKDEKTCETCRHWKYIAHEWQCEACKCQGYEPKTEPTGYNLSPVEDEPQTERSSE